MESLNYSRIRGVRTLGPAGTNLEAASRWWCESRAVTNADVILHTTLEDAVREMTLDGTEVLVGCIVYPDLHTLVFGNLEHLEISECFVFPTHRMVFASRGNASPRSVATHPSPQLLVPYGIAEKILVNSNSAAALECARGAVDSCVTTLVAAQAHGLQVVKDYGSLQMGFSVHAARQK
jgi:hypothetical protein